MDLKELIREVPDFPKTGIGFKDITTLLKDGDGFRHAVDLMQAEFEQEQITRVVGVETRGFMFAAALAYNWGVGFVPVRKHGKLPSDTIRESYALEYGSDHLEIHVDALHKGDRVLVVDDLLATGGTAAATCRLVDELGATIVGLSFLVELSFLNGREQLGDRRIFSILDYDQE